MEKEASELSEDEIFQQGIDVTLIELCSVLGVNTNSVSWDAATETLDGDIRAVIGNILRAKFGDEFDPKAPRPNAS